MEENENKQNLVRRFRYSFSSLANLMKIMEFLVLAYPKPFLDINSINFSYFASYLKNLSNRIIEKNYFSQIKTFFEKFKSENQQNEGIHIILLPIVGLFVNISKCSNNENYVNFVNKISNLSDLDLEPFTDIYDILKAENILKDKEAVTLENYKEIIEIFKEKVNRKSDRKMSVPYHFNFSWMSGKKQQKTKIFVFYVIQTQRIVFYFLVNMVSLIVK
jgi:hypothetical protein